MVMESLDATGQSEPPPVLYYSRSISVISKLKLLRIVRDWSFSNVTVSNPKACLHGEQFSELASMLKL